MSEKQFKKGEVIFHQGEEGNVFYRIIDGVVGIFANYDGGEDVKLTELKKDDFFGEMAVIDAAPRSGSAVALEDTTVYEISPDDLNAYLEKDPDSISALMKALSVRLRNLTRDYDEAEEIAARLYVDGSSPDEQEIRKLKKYTYYYKLHPGKKPVTSAEVIREETLKRNHAEGFAKNVVAYPKNTVICKEGDLMECMYDIHWGRVGIFSNYGKPEQIQLTTLGANDFFGEMGMISDEPRSATAVALDDQTTVEIIYPQDFRELFEKNPMKVDMILKHLSVRLRGMTNQYLDVCRRIAAKTGV